MFGVSSALSLLATALGGHEFRPLMRPCLASGRPVGVNPLRASVPPLSRPLPLPLLHRRSSKKSVDLNRLKKTQERKMLNSATPKISCRRHKAKTNPHFRKLWIRKCTKSARRRVWKRLLHCRPLHATAPTCDNFVWLPRALTFYPTPRRTQLLPAPVRLATVSPVPVCVCFFVYVIDVLELFFEQGTRCFKDFFFLNDCKNLWRAIKKSKEGFDCCKITDLSQVWYPGSKADDK